MSTAPPRTPTPPDPSITLATLRTLYTRAAPAFLHRDYTLTESLLTSAFSLLPQPRTTSSPDPLTAHRKKWDILRITLAATAYASPAAPSALPPSLRANHAQQPHTLLRTLHTQSLALFSPHTHTPSAAFLPPQVLLTLVLSALKLGVPDAGRGMVEEWLARRGQVEEVLADVDGYEKVVEVYCCEVLPRLELWDYAAEFLAGEQEIRVWRREVCVPFRSHKINVLRGL
jgi:hypothetical protein